MSEPTRDPPNPPPDPPPNGAALAVAEPPLTPERVFREYAPRVFHLARRMLGNQQDAEDVTQEVLLQVVRKLDTFRGESQFPTWLHRVTVNAALALRRKRSRREEKQLIDPLERFDDDGKHTHHVRPWLSRPDQPLMDEERKKLIERAIGELPEAYRDVLVLADVEQLANAEIGDMLGLSVAAVKSRLHRARLMMRDLLAPHFEENY
jgi:RNA polymerase sigma-70 factor, ECF subfamily